MDGRKRPVRLLTPASGYLDGYAYTLNPYTGCSFGCSYCYVRRMPVALFRKQSWGEWTERKPVRREDFASEWSRALAKGTVTVFMSSATDPYQPEEAAARLTRTVLETISNQPPAFILVQTRSPLVLRDADLLQQLGDRVRVSVTVETDLEEMRRRLTPAAPPLAARWRAIRELRRLGIPVQAAVSPLLPHSDAFAAMLAETAERVVVDDFFRGDGSGGKRSAQLKMRERYAQLGLEDSYAPETADRFTAELKRLMPPGAVYFGQEGFLP
ncbi:SPL family radical SAM protein [Paenibacillus humicola]|uniref:SPL family radical SAM protein n=1 Tax=Paenibacillus humicola TaxID=3110540 RepID=UPI00237A1592|nr:radical SAM protein [Paenibacillus humicola]